MRNIGVILAGGSGRRFGASVPKQFLQLAGKMVLEHSVDTFQEHALIDEITIVCMAEWIGLVRSKAKEKNWTKLAHVIEGGEERYLSSLNAIDLYRDGPECNIIFHDAARPFVSGGIITSTIRALDRWQAVDAAVPATDTVVKVDTGSMVIRDIPDRSVLFCEQTPQGFRKSVIAEAYRLAMADPEFKSTDDCGTVARYMPDIGIGIVPGSPLNIKLTYAEDIPVLEALYRTQKNGI